MPRQYEKNYLNDYTTAKYFSLRCLCTRYRNTSNFKYFITNRIFTWAKDENLSVSEFAFLTKKALQFLKNNSIY